MEKILITGTGRCGTTFLIKLFSFLSFDTGFDRHNYQQFIFANCNSGMERHYSDPHYILKNPTFMCDIETIAQDPSMVIKHIILPIRDLQQSASSRKRHGNATGGLWNAHDEPSQIEFYKEIIANFMCATTKHKIHVITLDFETMVSDKEYLFEQLSCILKERNVTFNEFAKVYDEVSLTSRPA